MFNNVDFLKKMRPKLKLLSSFVACIDTVEYNAKKRSSLAIKLTEEW